ncbi:MAG TPA: GLPGLI family protein [Saprospiraceae bacterium]|nr:GLPGLI family protein [Saprospiraceae bacterium]
MKKIFCSIFIIISQIGFTQSFNVVYEATTKYSKEILAMIPNPTQNIYRYSLIVDGRKSVFRRDSVLLINYSNSTEIFAKQEIYKDFEKDIWLRTGDTYVENTGYKREISDLTANNKFIWNATGRKKKILNMECIEVIFKDKIAWYTKSIPIPDGPSFGIFGLGGLVLEYEDSGGHWQAVNININDHFIVTKPIVNETNIEKNIKLTHFELFNVTSAIKIDKNTPIKRWIKFQ